MSNVSVQRCHGCTTSPRVFLVEVSSHCPLPQLCKKRSCSILPTSTAVACPRNLKHPILRMFEGNVASLMNVNLPETNASFREGSPVNFSNLPKKPSAASKLMFRNVTLWWSLSFKHLRLESFPLSFGIRMRSNWQPPFFALHMATTLEVESEVISCLCSLQSYSLSRLELNSRVL